MERPRLWFAEPDQLSDAERQRLVATEIAQGILQRADYLPNDCFPLFSLPAKQFDDPDRWQRDFVHEVASPSGCYAHVDYLDFDIVGDSKVVWEPNRFGWVYWLLSADCLEPKESYASCFLSWTRDWFERNPYPFGINYCSALEIALRNYAWLWALHYFRDALAGDESLLDRLVQGIWLGCRHLQRTLSHYFAPNTHLIGEAFALYVCGLVLPEFREANNWRRLGLQILGEQARVQIHRDGTHRELSTCYHLYATDFYLHAALLSQQITGSVPAELFDATERLVHRLAEFVTSDGRLPQLNDCDGGRLTWFALDPLDARPTLQAAESILAGLEEGDWRRAPWGDHRWLRIDDVARRSRQPADRANPPIAKSQVERIGKIESRASTVSRSVSADDFDSGIVTYRNAAGDYVLFRSGPFGYLDCGHSHDGQGEVIVHLGGHPILVDGGTGAYTQSLSIRNTFRTARACNVPLVNGNGPSTPDGWFTWRSTTHGRLVEVAKQAEQMFYCRGQHNGYSAPCGFSVSIDRQVTLLDEGVCVIVDHWESEKPIEVTIPWTMAPDLNHTRHGQFVNTADKPFWLCSVRWKPAVDAGGLPKLSEWMVRRQPFSSNYGSLGQTLGCESRLAPALHGVHATVISRMGPLAVADGRMMLMAADEPRELGIPHEGPCFVRRLRSPGTAHADSDASTPRGHELDMGAG